VHHGAALQVNHPQAAAATRLATLRPNTNSCLRLVSALLGEQDEAWMTAKIHLSMKP
jgi:hypothetical protein